MKGRVVDGSKNVKMRCIILSTLFVLQLFALMVAFERPAHAYVDPGSGLLVFQIIGSMFTGAIFIFRSKVKKLFHRSAVKPEAASADSTVEDGNHS